MNILVFSWRDIKHPLAGGAEQVDHEHHKGWILAGHSITLFTSSFPGSKVIDEVDGVKIIRKGRQILGVHFAAFLWFVFSKHEKFDLVVDEFHGIPFFTPFFVRKPKLAVLQEVAREVWLRNDLHFPLNFIIGYLGYFLEPLIFLFYRKIPFLVGSESARVQLIKIGIKSKNINVVPHGVILELPKKKIPKEKIKTVIYLGALAKDKGIEDAIQTFGILNNFDRYNFWIIGKGGGEYLTYLKKMCKDLNIDKNTVFWGFVSQKEKFELLSRGHIMVNPSLLEGFGLVNIEANSVGTPVVSYNSPGLTDSVRDNLSGIISDCNTPKRLAEIVYEILNNKEKYLKLQKGAVSWSRQFNWETSRKLSLALIEELGLK